MHKRPTLPPTLKVFDGPTAFSEVESTGARDKILEHKATMGAFFSIHTFGQLFLVPYSFSKTEVPPDYKEILVSFDVLNSLS